MEGIVAACIAAALGVAAARATAVLLLRSLQQQEKVVVHRELSDRVVCGAELCG